MNSGQGRLAHLNDAMVIVTKFVQWTSVIGIDDSQCLRCLYPIFGQPMMQTFERPNFCLAKCYYL